jgi:phage terminase large subunit
MRLLGFQPDPWQLEVLEGYHGRLLLNCSRQAGKSTTAAVLALHEALSEPGALVLILSPSLRQSEELFHRLAEFYRRLGAQFKKHLTSHELEFTFGSRVVSLPNNPDKIRCYSNVRMLIIDEASRVSDLLYRTVRPMLAVSGGRLLCLSTPNGRHGFFYREWINTKAKWHRIEVPATQVPRISAEFLEEEREALGELWYRQEYCCSFEALEGLVYPEFSKCVVQELPAHVRADAPGVQGRLYGGLDFGFRNPFAAVWGVLDRDDVLWLTGEYYESQQPLSHHVTRLPKGVMWHADPSGAAEIAELRRGNFRVWPAANAVRPGIIAVTARLNTGRLRVLAGACPNLLREASLYRCEDDAAGKAAETPRDEHNHALDALRYVVYRLDAGKLARPSTPAASPDAVPEKPRRAWLSVRNEQLWRPLYWAAVRTYV